MDADTARHPATIAAIATPPGRGGIGIVRVSGGESERIAAGLVGKVLRPRKATFVTFRDAHGEPIDQGIGLLFTAPGSYTGETVVELQGHGSPASLRLVLARCLELGARLAEPGEFTKRAFLNGKLDLAQAESVADLIEASTATAARAAVRSLSGEFSREVNAIVEGVTELRLFTEATLDFPEEDIEFVRAADARGTLAGLEKRLARLLERAATGARLAAGIVVVLIGRPNVGKSSLLNRLARDDVAIVAPVPGTTRDTVERGIEIGGIPLTIVDTAGLRATEDEVERLGVARTWSAVKRADVAIVLVDARAQGEVLGAEDRAVLAQLRVELPKIVVHNKIDLAGLEPAVQRPSGADPHVWISALTGSGVEGLEAEVLALCGIRPVGEDAFTARERHLLALREAQGRLTAAATHLASATPPLELFAEEMRGAQQALSTITGEFSADDLLGAIFSRFCIGK